MSKLADSTRRAYTTGWKQWTMFMSGTGRVPFLTGETRAEKQVDEAWLIRFVVFLHEVMGRTAQGIKQRLSAIRYAHIATGHADPFQGRVRLWASLQGLARWESAPDRKVPVTPIMLSWLKRYLIARAQLPNVRRPLPGLQSACGWFFMLRASEYLPPTDPCKPGLPWCDPRVRSYLLPGRSGGPALSAGSVSIQLRESKTDQSQRGQVRTHHRTREEICPLEALKAHGRENPVWLNDPSAVVFQYQGVGPRACVRAPSPCGDSGRLSCSPDWFT